MPSATPTEEKKEVSFPKDSTAASGDTSVQNTADEARQKKIENIKSSLESLFSKNWMGSATWNPFGARTRSSQLPQAFRKLKELSEATDDQHMVNVIALKAVLANAIYLSTTAKHSAYLVGRTGKHGLSNVDALEDNKEEVETFIKDAQAALFEVKPSEGDKPEAKVLYTSKLKADIDKVAVSNLLERAATMNRNIAERFLKDDYSGTKLGAFYAVRNRFAQAKDKDFTMFMVPLERMIAKGDEASLQKAYDDHIKPMNDMAAIEDDSVYKPLAVEFLKAMHKDLSWQPVLEHVAKQKQQVETSSGLQHFTMQATDMTPAEFIAKLVPAEVIAVAKDDAVPAELSELEQAINALHATAKKALSKPYTELKAARVALTPEVLDEVDAHKAARLELEKACLEIGFLSEQVQHGFLPEAERIDLVKEANAKLKDVVSKVKNLTIATHTAKEAFAQPQAAAESANEKAKAKAKAKAKTDAEAKAKAKTDAEAKSKAVKKQPSAEKKPAQQASILEALQNARKITPQTAAVTAKLNGLETIARASVKAQQAAKAAAKKPAAIKKMPKQKGSLTVAQIAAHESALQPQLKAINAMVDKLATPQKAFKAADAATRMKKGSTAADAQEVFAKLVLMQAAAATLLNAIASAKSQKEILGDKVSDTQLSENVVKATQAYEEAYKALGKMDAEGNLTLDNDVRQVMHSQDSHWDTFMEFCKNVVNTIRGLFCFSALQNRSTDSFKGTYDTSSKGRMMYQLHNKVSEAANALKVEPEPAAPAAPQEAPKPKPAVASA